ncbi:sulfurtransferase TusA family protein [Pelagibacterium limicola]|uniref:sulfurtransferase TusA family protein n=1 Tax=Pelagibacterium limicola TaxID=2791022 RepID=UPI0018AFA378|nr:sulfurtransferase TusA family protein [Pelagibacterium limicola]
MPLDSRKNTEATIVDARGEKCPLPVLRTEKALALLGPGAKLVVLATDPVARIDIALYCQRNGHAVDIGETGDTLRFEIVRG